MAVSKFAVACVAVILAGGATAGLADGDAAAPAVQVTDERPVTPIAAIANARDLLRGIPVRLVSGKEVGRVLAVRTNTRGHATRVNIAVDGVPGASVWVDQSDLVYNRAADAMIAHDIHAPSMTIASR